MKQIIIISDILKYKHIATAFKGATDLDGHILEAQMCDLEPWLGGAFLYELTEQRASNTLTPANTLLLYGGMYAYHGSNYHCGGLADYMAFSVHARYTLRSSVSLTQYGAVVKESDYSTPASSKQISEIKNTSLATAEAVKQSVVALLDRMPTDYPLYKCGNQHSKRQPLFRVVGE